LLWLTLARPRDKVEVVDKHASGAVILALLVLLALLGGCGPRIVTDPPPRPDFSLLDPDVAELLQNMVAGIEKNPGDAAARGEYGLACDLFSITPSARTAFEQAVKLDPDTARWWYHLARIRAELGEIEAALADIDTAISLETDYAPAHWRRGQWLLELGDLPAAQAAFTSALEHDATATAARVGLARCHIQLDQEDEAITILDQLVEEAPGIGYYHYLLATAYRQKGQLDLATTVQPGAATRPPPWSDPWRDARMQYQVGYAADLQQALRILRQKDYARAIPLLEELRTRRQDDVTLLNNLGAAYVDIDEVTQGVRTLRDALNYAPDHFSTHLNLSLAYQKLGLMEKAVEHADMAIAANPFLPQAHERRGLALARLKRFAEADASLDTAIGFDATRVQSLYWSGLVKIELKSWGAAVETLEAALALSPRNLNIHYALIHALMQNGDRDAADAALDAAVALNPEDPRIDRLRQRIASMSP
jgi:tetratricopeptide (TPR) repeat protein